MNKSGIYIIQSLSHPERCYIGSAYCFNERWSHHKTQLRDNKHHSSKLQHHYNKYGKDDLVFEVIETGEYLDKNNILAREQMWFGRYSFNGSKLPYFNISPIAGNSKGRVMTEETKAIMRKLIQSKETRLKNSEKNKGHIVKEETKRKISDKQSEPVYQYDINGVFIKEWNSVVTASKLLNIGHGSISGCASGGRRKLYSAGGFIWKYKKDIQIPVNLTKDEIGNIGRKNQQKLVLQFTKDGVFIREWSYLREASNELSISECYIGMCCRGTAKTAGGFVWRYKSDIDTQRNLTPEELGESSKTAKKPVIQFTKDGQFISEWKSIHEAGKLFSCNGSAIVYCCKGKAKTAYGFIWRYMDEISVPWNLTKKELKGVNCNKRHRSVFQYDLEGIFLTKWGRIAEAARSLSINPSGISLCCGGVQRTAGGFVWKYKNVA